MALRFCPVRFPVKDDKTTSSARRRVPAVRLQQFRRYIYVPRQQVGDPTMAKIESSREPQMTRAHHALSHEKTDLQNLLEPDRNATYMQKATKRWWPRTFSLLRRHSPTRYTTQPIFRENRQRRRQPTRESTIHRRQPTRDITSGGNINSRYANQQPRNKAKAWRLQMMNGSRTSKADTKHDTLKIIQSLPFRGRNNPL